MKYSKNGNNSKVIILYEKLISHIISKGVKDLSKLLGYNESNSGRLNKDLLKLRVSGENVIVFVITDGLKTIYVNPRVFYKGTKIEELNHLIEIFDENSDKVTINIRDEYSARTTNNNKSNSRK